ncbi:MAG: NfeD family protein [Gammaproteobacteria bacterium]
MRIPGWLVGLALILIPLSAYAIDKDAPTFFQYLKSPDIAYLLLLLGIYGLFFELTNSGLIVPGLVGLFSLLLALYAFQIIPINYIGLMLIFIGFTFMAAEVYLFNYGVLGIIGVITLLVGSVMLFDVPGSDNHLNWTLVFGMSVFTIAFFVMVMTLAFQSHKKSVKTGKEGLIGSDGIVISQMNKQVIARVHGEMWEIIAPETLNVGDHVKVTGINGLKLNVTKVSDVKE